MGAKDGDCDNVDHEVAEKIEAVDRSFSGNVVEGLSRDQSRRLRSLSVTSSKGEYGSRRITYIHEFEGEIVQFGLE